MPNHVESDLTITGSRADLDEFAAFAKEDIGPHAGALSASRFIPYPEEYRIADAAHAVAMERQKRGEITTGEALAVKDGFNAGGYDWCCKHWGTKWGIYDAKQKPRAAKGTTLIYSFQSAWSPPIPVLKVMSKMFPRCTFVLRWYERGMQLQGVYRCEGGAVVHEEQSQYTGKRGG